MTRAPKGIGLSAGRAEGADLIQESLLEDDMTAACGTRRQMGIDLRHVHCPEHSIEILPDGP